MKTEKNSRNKLKLSKPFSQQEKFLRAKSRYVGYGGSRGGGKSHAVRLKATLLALRYPGIKILILRKTYPELYENHIKIMASELRDVAKYKDADKSLTFIGGSRIKFGYCANDGDVLQYQGVEYDVIFMDEATHFTEYQFVTIRACMRGANDFPKRFYITCNPGGIGHEWVKRLFIDKSYRTDEKPEDYTFIRATVYDNKPLLEKDAEYLNTLRNLPDDLRRAWLEGDWDLFAGQFFSEFRRDIHVCEPFEIPDYWRRYRAFDYGLDMLACIWAAVDDGGNIFIYRELCEPNLIVSDAASRITELSFGEEIHDTIAPPDMWNRQKDSGRSMYELFEEGGLRLVRADNNRVQGWMSLKEWLKPMARADGEGYTAKLRIFGTCTELIRCLPALQHDLRNPSDCSSEPHDITHICDALRYLVRERTRAAKPKKEETPEQKWRKSAIRKSSSLARKGHVSKQ